MAEIWLFDENNPFDDLDVESEILCREVAGRAARVASNLESSWHLRPTPDLYDPYLEARALRSVGKLSELNSGEYGDLASLPDLPFFDESSSAQAALAEVQLLLPFSEMELLALPGLAEKWAPEELPWSDTSDLERALIIRWHSWIRLPENGTGELPVNPDAQRVVTLSRSLYYCLKSLLPYEGP